MALKYLRDSIDIHGGGQDLIFPHHENEIAQSESFTGVVPFARYWLHNGLMQLGEQKVSKSTGNLVTVKELLSRFSPDAIRLFVLSSHYRNPLTYSQRNDNGGAGSLHSEPFKHNFIEAMDDDFSTAQAVATLFELAREINRGREQAINVTEAQGTLTELAGILGLTLEERAKPALDAEAFIQLLISIRDDLRAAEQWQLADRIRAYLLDLDIALEDTPRGTIWKRKM